jgi:hypothetical protein
MHGIKTRVIRNSYISLIAFYFISTMIELANIKRSSHFEVVTIPEKFACHDNLSPCLEGCRLERGLHLLCLLSNEAFPTISLACTGTFHITVQCCLTSEPVLPASNSTWIRKCKIRSNVWDLPEAQHGIGGRNNLHLLLSRIFFKWLWDVGLRKTPAICLTEEWRGAV